MGARDIRALLEEYGLRPKRGLGQCFLADGRAVDAIAETATEEPCAGIVEVGAGFGVLTASLAMHTERPIAAIERDRELVPILRKRFGADPRIHIFEADATEVRFATLLPGVARPALAGNLPYNVTTPLLLAFLEQRAELGPATLMVQREVAERLLARPRSKAYGSLTLLFGLHAEVVRVLELPPSAFWPAPKVHSTVLKLRWLDAPRVEGVDPMHLEQVVRVAFGQRRKTLRNALSARFEREHVASAGAGAGIDLDRRAETLDLAEFARLADALQRAR